MATTKYDVERLRKGLERKIVHVDNSVVRIEDEIYHKELYQSLPWKVIFGGLSEYERQLFYLHMVEGMSIKEIAHELNKDISHVRYNVLQVQAKITYKVKKLLQKDKAENKLLLAWEQIRSKRKRIAS